MELYISGLSEVAQIQKEKNITKTLSVIEFDPRSRYMDFYQGLYMWIKVDDMEFAGKSLVNPEAVTPDQMHIHQIISFYDSLIYEDKVLIHCFAGVSRSTATALIILYLYFKKRGDDNPIKIAGETLLTIRPQAAPNRLFCKYADEILDIGTLLYDEAHRINTVNNYRDFWNAKGQDWDLSLGYYISPEANS